MFEPQHRPHRQYTTGRPWLDVLLVWFAIILVIAGVIIFIRIGLPFTLFGVQLLGVGVIVPAVVALFVWLSISIAWRSRRK